MLSESGEDNTGRILLDETEYYEKCTNPAIFEAVSSCDLLLSSPELRDSVLYSDVSVAFGLPGEVGTASSLDLIGDSATCEGEEEATQAMLKKHLQNGWPDDLVNTSNIDEAAHAEVMFSCCTVRAHHFPIPN